MLLSESILILYSNKKTKSPTQSNV